MNDERNPDGNGNGHKWQEPRRDSGACSNLKTAQFLLDAECRSAILTTNADFERRIIIISTDSEEGIVVFIGGEDVTPEDGYPLLPRERKQFAVGSQTVIKAVIAPNQAGSARVYVMELG